MLFQIVDDILDVTGTDAALGKPQGSDERHGKRTYVSRVRARRRARAGRASATPAARARSREAAPDGRPELEQITDFIFTRTVMTHLTASSTASTARRTSTASPRRSSQQVAQEVREHIIDTVGEIGGHFGANLGTLRAGGRAALAAGLAARQDPLGRRPPGLPAQGPHRPPRRSCRRSASTRASRRSARSRESEHDIMGAGHASTSIGYAVGLKEAHAPARRAPTPARSSRSIGDGAMTGGVAFEAIHQAGGLGTPIVVVLNDNGMSIAPNVGALSRYFNRVRLNPKLWHAREGVEGRLTKLPGGIGARFERLGPQLKESIKAFWAPGPVVGGARLGLHGRHRRPRRRARCGARCARRSPPSGPSSSTSRPSRARASRPPRRAAWRAWRSGTPPSPSRSPTARRASPSRCRSPPSRAAAAAVHEGLRRRARRGGAAATSASSASPPR